MTQTCYSETNPDFANIESPNPANQCVGEQLTSGNSLIGTTIDKVSMWCYYTGSPGSAKCTFGVYGSNRALKSESAEFNITDLGSSTDPPALQKDLSSSVELALEDIIAVRTVSAPSGFAIKVRQCDGCSGGQFANGRRAIFVKDGTSTSTSSSDVNFCVTEVVTPTSSEVLLPPEPAMVRL